MYTVRVIEDSDDYQEEQVWPCERYERTLYKGDIHENYNPDEPRNDGPIPRKAETSYQHLTLYNGEETQIIGIPHSVLDQPKKKHIYIMNEEGKTIDSY